MTLMTGVLRRSAALSSLLVAALLTNSCVSQRATDFLTKPRRAVDGPYWEKRANAHPKRFVVKAADGVVLSCLEVESRPGVKRLGTAYLFHGLGNSKEQMLPTAMRLAEAGFRCVAWDSRGHGKSGGDHATYGTREVDDALRVVETARRRDRSPRGAEVFWGYSMGTATALQILPTMPEVRAAVLLAPIADLGRVIRYQASSRYHGTMIPLLPLVRSNVRREAGFDPKVIRPVDALKRTQCKLMLIHGGKDETIPPSQSKMLLDASAPGQAKSIVLPGFGHQGVMWDLPVKYRGEAVEFLRKEVRH